MKENNIKINGIAHIALSVRNIESSKVFYKELLPFMGLKLIHESSKSCYHIGGRTGILIQQADDKNEGDIVSFSQKNVGLHHFCFRLLSRQDVHLTSNKLKLMNANIIRGPLEGPWVKGYYYVLFEDPDGIRLEANFVPEKGVFSQNNNFNPDKDY